MPTYSLRCRNSKCRHRRVSRIHPDDFKRVPKCPCCGEKKGWRIENRDYNKRDLCTCNHTGTLYPHRVGKHPRCDHHPDGYFNQALRRGEGFEDIPLEYLGRKMRPHDACPF